MNTPGSDYDFLGAVFEWLFYHLPPRADNSFIRNMYNFYKSRGGLSKKQLQALLHTIQGLNTQPPFNIATLEAIIRKKATKTKSPLPPVTPLYKAEDAVRQQLEEILQWAPTHKAALLYMNKLTLHEPLSIADRDAINRFHTVLGAAQKK